MSTTLVGLNRSYRNKMTFSSPGPTSKPKPKMQAPIVGFSDPSGSIGVDSSDELRHVDCIQRR